MKGIMIQGTSSDAGKSFLVTGLCRLLSDMGVKVCPFKSQNMSNNSYVTWDGLEISRAQAVQAEAARLSPEAFMNPVLLKPRRDTSSEIVLNGRVLEAPAERDYYRNFTMNEGIAAVRKALKHIEGKFDAVVIEGAGSPAEINLNSSEIVNMRIAREADVPVILVADVDRGGSLASIVGTLQLLDKDRERVKGLVFNKFRGDSKLFEDAVRWVENYTGVKVLGVMPWLNGVSIAGEDSLSLRWGKGGRGSDISIGVIRFPGMSNFNDIEPFDHEQDVELRMIDSETSFKTLHSMNAIILPGSRNAMLDMQYLHETGLADELRTFVKNGGFIFGICGGYNMLGIKLKDFDSDENSGPSEVEGLELLPIETVFTALSKVTESRSGTLHPVLTNVSIPVEGYEVHSGMTTFFPFWAEGKGKKYVPLFSLLDSYEGLASDGLVLAGTYLHGVFHNDGFRTFWLNNLRRAFKLPERDVVDTGKLKDNAYDALADSIRKNLDVKFILSLMGL